jgi:glucosamine-6-phosphate deaminase
MATGENPKIFKKMLIPHEFKKDNLHVMLFENRSALGEAAAEMAGKKFKALLKEKSVINVIFAAAPSQSEFLHALRTNRSIPWSRINAFHMDEYLGLSDSAPQRFGNFLRHQLFDHVPLRSVNYIDGDCPDSIEECQRYGKLITDNPPDVVCMGIGENTHIAFNDPHIANFEDPEIVKMVSLDQACRQQQVNDGCFKTLEAVPQYALTLTIPALLQAPFIYCMVPGKTKEQAVTHTLDQPISEVYPSTVLKKHQAAVLFVDKDSYCLL